MTVKGYLIFLLIFLIPNLSQAMESTCYGSTGNGHLENGMALPGEGKNFISYGLFPKIAGRTYVHNRVHSVILDAYRRLEIEQPGKVFKYGETGFKEGGKFNPHKTHQNGLSVDFFVPVLDNDGRSTHFPTNPLNKYGYNFEFDEKGKRSDYRDFLRRENVTFDDLLADMRKKIDAAKAKQAESEGKKSN